MRIAGERAVWPAMQSTTGVPFSPDHAADAAARRPMEHQTVPIIDLAPTLTVRGTWSPFLLFAARRRARWRLGLVPVVLGLMLGYRAGLLRRKRLKELMHRLMVGGRTRRAELDSVAAAFAELTLRGNVRRGMLEIVAREKDEGRMLILATAAHRFYAEPIARRLGIDHVVATESLSEAAAVRHLIDGPNCYGVAKSDAVAAKLAELGLERRSLTLRCYSDDASDLPLLAASDEPVAVAPSPKLRRLAEERRLPIMTFR